MWVWVVQPNGSAEERGKGKGSHLPLGCKMQGNDLRGTVVANAPSNITRSFTGCLIVWHSISWYSLGTVRHTMGCKYGIVGTPKKGWKKWSFCRTTRMACFVLHVCILQVVCLKI